MTLATSPSWQHSAPLIHAYLTFLNPLQVLIWLIQTLFVCRLSGPPVTNRMFCCVKTDLHFLSVLPGILKHSHNKPLSKVLVWITQRRFWLVPAGSWCFKYKGKKEERQARREREWGFRKMLKKFISIKKEKKRRFVLLDEIICQEFKVVKMSCESKHSKFLWTFSTKYFPEFRQSGCESGLHTRALPATQRRKKELSFLTGMEHYTMKWHYATVSII